MRVRRLLARSARGEVIRAVVNPRVLLALDSSPSRYIAVQNAPLSEETQEVEGSRSPTLASSTNAPRGWPWLRGKNPPRSATSSSTQRAYLDWLGQKLSYSSRGDWYKVTNKDFISNSGQWLLRLHGESSAKAVRSIFTDHKFLPWLFPKAGKNFFKVRENRLQYAEWLRQKVGVEKLEDLKWEDFAKHHGGGALSSYGGSPKGFLDSITSEDSVLQANGLNSSEKPFKTRDMWASKENQRVFLDSIGAKIGVKGADLSPWYAQEYRTLTNFGCLGLMRTKYNSSLFDMLRNLYPEHLWVPWKFVRLPTTVERDPDILKQALTALELERNIRNPSDWYSVSRTHLTQMGILSLIEQFGGLAAALRLVKPEFDWEDDRFGAVKKERRTAQSEST